MTETTPPCGALGGNDARTRPIDHDTTRQLAADLQDALATYRGPVLMVGRDWAYALVAAVLGDDAMPAR
jgi:hypothetical protein